VTAKNRQRKRHVRKKERESSALYGEKTNMRGGLVKNSPQGPGSNGTKTGERPYGKGRFTAHKKVKTREGV